MPVLLLRSRRVSHDLDYPKLIREVYRIWNPVWVNTIPSLLRKYAGMWPEVYDRVCKKYKVPALPLIHNPLSMAERAAVRQRAEALACKLKPDPGRPVAKAQPQRRSSGRLLGPAQMPAAQTAKMKARRQQHAALDCQIPPGRRGLVSKASPPQRPSGRPLKNPELQRPPKRARLASEDQAPLEPRTIAQGKAGDCLVRCVDHGQWRQFRHCKSVDFVHGRMTHRCYADKRCKDTDPAARPY